MSDQDSSTLDENQAEALFSGADATHIDDRHHRRLLTIKTIEAHPERAFTLGRRIPLVLWKGIAHGIQTTKSPDTEQEFDAMAGEFECTVYLEDRADKYLDGPTIIWYGGLSFMPGGFHEAGLSKMSVMDPEKLRDPGFVFALEFWAEPRAGKGTNYSYIARSMMREIRAHDRLSLLRLETERVRQFRLSHQPQIIDVGQHPLTDTERANKR